MNTKNVRTPFIFSLSTNIDLATYISFFKVAHVYVCVCVILSVRELPLAQPQEIHMKNTFKKIFSTTILTFTLIFGGTHIAYGTTFGNSLNGASSVEVWQIKYNGAAWNYSGSGYKNASFKYTRNGKLLLAKKVNRGKVKGSVWDDLRWGEKYKTKFSWNHVK